MKMNENFVKMAPFYQEYLEKYSKGDGTSGTRKEDRARAARMEKTQAAFDQLVRESEKSYEDESELDRELRLAREESLKIEED